MRCIRDLEDWLAFLVHLEALVVEMPVVLLKVMRGAATMDLPVRSAPVKVCSRSRPRSLEWKRNCLRSICAGRPWRPSSMP